MSWIVRIAIVGVAGVVALAAIASADRGTSLSMDEVRQFLLDEQHRDSSPSVREEFPRARSEELGQALETLAGGIPSALSSRAAAALSQLRRIDEPLSAVHQLFHDSDREMTEPQWALWLASSTEEWIRESGFAACLSELTMVRFEERIEIYEAIGASRASDVMRRALAMREGLLAVERSGLNEDLRALDGEFLECREEIVTRSLLHALDHASHFER